MLYPPARPYRCVGTPLRRPVGVLMPLERGFGVRVGVCLLVTAVGMGVGVDMSMLMRVHNIAMTVRVAMNMRVRMGVLERDRILNHYYGAHGHDS